VQGKLESYLTSLISAVIISFTYFLWSSPMITLLLVTALCIFSFLKDREFEPMADTLIISAVIMMTVFGIGLIGQIKGDEMLVFSATETEVIMVMGCIWLIPFFIYTLMRMLTSDGHKINSRYYPFFIKSSICFGVMYAIFFAMVFFLFREVNIYSTYDDNNLNLEPFKTIVLMLEMDDKIYALKNLLGNVLFFFPPGFYFAIVFKKSKWFIALAVALIFSGAIEYLQLILDKGTCDIDDVLLNVIGFLLGYTLKKTLDLIRLKITKGQEKTIFKKTTENIYEEQ